MTIDRDNCFQEKTSDGLIWLSYDLCKVEWIRLAKFIVFNAVVLLEELECLNQLWGSQFWREVTYSELAFIMLTF